MDARKDLLEMLPLLASFPQLELHLRMDDQSDSDIGKPFHHYLSTVDK
jgi:hypothetical protein